MEMHAGPISRLIAELSRLPGIGQRTAQRLAFHILRAAQELASSKMGGIAGGDLGGLGGMLGG